MSSPPQTSMWSGEEQQYGNWDLKPCQELDWRIEVSLFMIRQENEGKRSRASVCCVSHAFVLVCWQPAGGERHPCEVHLWPVGGGFLEPCLHGHTGSQRLRQGERGQRERKCAACKQKLHNWVLHICVFMWMCAPKPLVCIMVSWRLLYVSANLHNHEATLPKILKHSLFLTLCTYRVRVFCFIWFSL